MEKQVEVEQTDEYRQKRIVAKLFLCFINLTPLVIEESFQQVVVSFVTEHLPSHKHD